METFQLQQVRQPQLNPLLGTPEEKFDSLSLFSLLLQYKQKNMPTLFYYLGLQFHFYSNDHLPIHIHVSIDNSEARYQVHPEIKLIENRGLKPRELRLAEVAIEENREVIISRWKEYLKNKSHGSEL